MLAWMWVVTVLKEIYELLNYFGLITKVSFAKFFLQIAPPSLPMPPAFYTVSVGAIRGRKISTVSPELGFYL